MSTITIGIDAHKRSHTANAIDETEQVIDRGAPTRQRRPGRQATGLGRTLARPAVGRGGRCWHRAAAGPQLVAAGETVVDVPLTLAARTRLLDTGKHARTTTSTRGATAVAGLRRRQLRDVAPEDFSQLLRLLVDRRDQLCAYGPAPSTGCTAT